MVGHHITIPMAMSPNSSKRTCDLAQRMLQLTADEYKQADISECLVAAMYVMAAYIALSDNHAEIVGDVSNKIAALVDANHAEFKGLNRPS
jgi:hypothetical protein